MPLGTYTCSINRLGARTKICPRCHKVVLMPTAMKSHSFQYIVHVIQECEEYKELNLIRECKICNYKCMNDQAYNAHESMNLSSRPKWSISCRSYKYTKCLLKESNCREAHNVLFKTGFYFTIDSFVHID